MSTSITGPGIDSGTASGMLESRNLEDPRQPLTGAQLAEVLIGPNTRKLGARITPETSKRISTVLACVRIISEAIARMPLIVYERNDGGRERALRHPYYSLLALRPNLGGAAFTLFQSLIANGLLWGNGYAELVRNAAGIVQSIHAIESYRVEPFRLPGDTELTYRVHRAGGSPVTLMANEILHIPGLSFNGITGESVIQHAKRTLGLADANVDAAGYMAQQGLRAGGFIEAEGTVDVDAGNKLKKDFDTLYSGPENSGRAILLPKGLKFKPANIPAQDAELVEARKMSRSDIAEIFGVPLSMLGAIENAGNNNVEAASLGFLNYTLAPWITRVQQEVNFKLFGDSMDIYAEFLTQVILAMDAKTRGEMYGKLFGVGAMNGDEIRARENMNQLPDSRGKTYYVPSNMMPAPKPDQADKLLEAFTAKAAKGDPSGKPNPDADGKVAGSSNNS